MGVGRLGALAVAGALGLIIAILPLRITTLLIIGAILAVPALLDPVWALCLLVLSVPVQAIWLLPGGLTVTQAALLLAVASLGMHVLAFPERPLVLGRLFIPLAAFVWVLALSATFTPFSLTEGLRETTRWSTVLLVYLLAMRALSRRSRSDDADDDTVVRQSSSGVSWRVAALLVCLLAAPLTNGVLGLVQFALGLGPESFAIGATWVRAYGTIGQPNSFAGYMNQSWPLAAGVALFALIAVLQGVSRRLANWVLVGAGLVAALTGAALVVSFSRGGWVGAVAGAMALLGVSFVMLPVKGRTMLWRWLLIGIGIVVVVLGLGGSELLPDAVERRFVSLVNNLRLFDARGVEVTPENFAVVERMAHLQAGWRMFRKYPLLGVGTGNFSIAYEHTPGAGEWPFRVWPWRISRGHAHNYYLHIAAEAGVLGASAYALLIGAVILQIGRAVRRVRGWLWSGIVAGSAGVVAAVAVHNLFENLHVLNMGLQLGSIWALLTLGEEDRQ